MLWSYLPLHLVDPKIDKIHKIHAPKFQGVFFLRSPKRRRQLPPDAQCWGTLKPLKNVKY